MIESTEDPAEKIWRAGEIKNIDEPDNWLPGTLGYHEVVVAADLVMDAFSEKVYCHPAALLDDELFALASRALDAVHEFYRAAATKE